jgi:hypothetical protein
MMEFENEYALKHEQTPHHTWACMEFKHKRMQFIEHNHAQKCTWAIFMELDMGMHAIDHKHACN